MSYPSNRPTNTWVFYDELAVGNLARLNARQRAIIEYRFGVSDDSERPPHTLLETSRQFGITLGVIRCLESAVLSRHRHPASNTNLRKETP